MTVTCPHPDMLPGDHKVLPSCFVVIGTLFSTRSKSENSILKTIPFFFFQIFFCCVVKMLFLFNTYKIDLFKETIKFQSLLGHLKRTTKKHFELSDIFVWDLLHVWHTGRRCMESEHRLDAQWISIVCHSVINTLC